MAYEITVEPDLVRAELVGGETAQETKDFLRALAPYSTSHSLFLIRVRASNPMFRLEEHGLMDYFREVACSASHKVALLADTLDQQVSHEYVEFIARQRGINVRSFHGTVQALRWLRDRASQSEVA